MTKQVIRDYFTAFRWGKIKEYYKNGGWFMLLYMTVLVPIILQGFDTVEDILNYYFSIIPMVFCIFGAPLHPVALPKIMYLCPMSEGERREYVQKYFWLKIAVPVLLCSLLMSILLVMNMTDVSIAGTVVLETTLLGLVLGIDSEAAINLGGKGVRKPVIKELGAWYPIAGTVGIVMACFAAYIAMGGWETWEMILTGSVIVLIQLPLTIKVMRYYRQIIENAMNFENVRGN